MSSIFVQHIVFCRKKFKRRFKNTNESSFSECLDNRLVDNYNILAKLVERKSLIKNAHRVDLPVERGKGKQKNAHPEDGTGSRRPCLEMWECRPTWDIVIISGSLR